MDWQAVPWAHWSGRAPARLLRDKVGAPVVAIITGGTATATTMRATVIGIAFPADIAVNIGTEPPRASFATIASHLTVQSRR